MTRTEFLTGHGAEFRKLARKPVFAALLDLIDSESPAKKLDGLPATDRFNGAQMYLSEIHGWEKLRTMLGGLGEAPVEDVDVKDKFNKEEVI